MSYWSPGSGLPEPAFAADNPVMASAFRSFLEWVWSEDGAHTAFQAESGMRRMPLPRNGLERMIDDATGVGDHYALAFIAWAIKTQWGEAGDPLLDEADEDGSQDAASSGEARQAKPAGDRTQVRTTPNLPPRAKP